MGRQDRPIGPVPAPQIKAGRYRLDEAALDTLLPLSLSLDAHGQVRWIGRSVPKVFCEKRATSLVGRSFFDLFDVRRPRLAVSVNDLIEHDRGRLRIIPKRADAIPLKGVAVRCHDGALINLSFGISGIEAVQRFDLTAGDFAHTDLTIELLYLYEANEAAMADSKRLNQRLRIAHAAAERKALTDALTGLKNRRAFENLVDRLLSDREPFSMVHLDLDKFKQVNDTFGHAAGDTVLQSVAERLTSSVRGTDMISRIGGDEFVIIMRNATTRDQLATAASRIIEGIERPIEFQQEAFEISVSIGMTISTNYEAPNSADMQRDADLALYRSKENGRGCYTFFSDLSEPSEETQPDAKS